jgi:ribosomal protein L22
MSSAEEPENVGAESESGAGAGRSEEPGAAPADKVTRAASGADPSASPHGDELEEAVEPAGIAEEPAEEEEPAEIAEEPAEEQEPAEIAEEPAEAKEPADAKEPPAPARRPRSAPRRRGAQRDPDLPPPVVRAQAKYVRSSARKARLVCDHIRGKSVEEARAILALAPRAIARDWSKLLESAVANAEHNHELVGEDLYVKSVHADEGPTIKRFRPRAMGRATRIRKRTSHLTILLTPKD